tara:strand:- start:735 stop:1679 length:945 start_codon:yes stop_codon:yes gene_type:complete
MSSDAITSLATYMSWLERHTVPKGKVAVFRGHPDVAFDLKPSAFRNDRRKEREHLMLRELIAVHPTEFLSDTTALEQLVRMQHYSLPTRLLDVTWNPLVALWFASEYHDKKIETGRLTKGGRPEQKTVKTPGEIIRIVLDEGLVRYFDSDRVSCVANLARCTPEQKAELRLMVDTSTKSEAGIKVFNNQPTVRRLLHFIRTEKPSFEAEIIPEHLDGIFVMKPKMNNSRILAQEGAFLAFGLSDELPPLGTGEIKIDRIRLEVRNKQRVRGQLAQLSINERTLFPEIDRAARYLTEEMETADLLSRRASSSPKT